jgi:hypothetical protein
LSAEKAFRCAFMASNGRRNIVQKHVMKPIKTGVTESGFTDNDGMQNVKRIVRFSCKVKQRGGVKLSPKLATFFKVVKVNETPQKMPKPPKKRQNTAKYAVFDLKIGHGIMSSLVCVSEFFLNPWLIGKAATNTIYNLRQFQVLDCVSRRLFILNFSPSQISHDQGERKGVKIHER